MAEKFLLTIPEFDACLLSKRISFRESEAARQILVSGWTIQEAAVAVGLDTKEGHLMIKAAVKLFTEAHLNR